MPSHHDTNLSSPAPVALVTGSAGLLGRHIVRELSGQGWQVLAGWHRNPPKSENPAITPIPLDLTRTADHENVREHITHQFGRLTALIHAAGHVRDQTLPRMSVDDWNSVLQVNLIGVHRLTRSLTPLLRQDPNSHVLFIGSLSGQTGRRGQANYSAAKGALHGLTRALASELGHQNIRVNLLIPGWMPSDLSEHLGPETGEHQRASQALPSKVDPKEFARFVAFLLTTRHISGQTFQLDSRPPPTR